MTSTLEAVAALKRPIQQWTRGWMLVKGTDERGVALGLRDGEQFWIVGRAGVLGDGDADVATAGLAYIAPGRVRAAWDHLPAGLTPRRVADAYTACILDWGERELPRFGEEPLRRPGTPTARAWVVRIAVTSGRGEARSSITSSCLRASQPR